VNINAVHTHRGFQRLGLTGDGPPPQTVLAPGDGLALSDSARKSVLIESMIRVSPNEKATEKLISSLSLLPTEALERIKEYGTRFEVHDKNAESLPLYARHLTKPNLAGAYSPTANVVFVDQNNITPRILVHESLHALDMALGQPSAQKPWTVARDMARQSRKAIRAYATHNSSEYFADNLAASLFSKEDLTRTLVHDLRTQTGTQGLSKQELVANHAHYHREGQEQADPLAAKLCQRFWEVMPKYPEAKPRPALTPREYKAVLVDRLQKKRAAGS
jgi:nucleotide-binding universal stress UspA family protein